MPSIKNQTYLQRFQNFATKNAIFFDVSATPCAEIDELMAGIPHYRIHLKRKLINKFYPEFSNISFSPQTLVAFVNSKQEVQKIKDTFENSTIYRYPRLGETLAFDIIIPSGPTTLKAGPMLREFTLLGAKAILDKGFISLKSDFKLVPTGQQITIRELMLLQKLGMQNIVRTLKTPYFMMNGDIISQENYNALANLDVQSVFQQIAISQNIANSLPLPTKQYVRTQISKFGVVANNIVELISNQSENL